MSYAICNFHVKWKLTWLQWRELNIVFKWYDGIVCRIDVLLSVRQFGALGQVSEDIERSQQLRFLLQLQSTVKLNRLWLCKFPKFLHIVGQQKFYLSLISGPYVHAWFTLVHRTNNVYSNVYRISVDLHWENDDKQDQ